MAALIDITSSTRNDTYEAHLLNQTFFDAWSVYQKIVSNNYMYHNEITSNLRMVLKPQSNLSILDIGCGDAYVVSKALSPLQIGHYVGVDSSKTALDHARSNLSNITRYIEFINCDMVNGISTLENKFDVVIAGYSLHHLESRKKKSMIEKIFEILKSNGIFILYDVLSKPGETAVSYNRRACDIFRSKWFTLTTSELDSVTNHVMENDYPESKEFYEKSAGLAGFVKIDTVFEDEDELFALLTATK